MGRGYLGQGHRPSSGLIHALHQGVGAPRCVCVSHARHRGCGGIIAENCSGGGGAAVDREEVNDGKRVKKKEKKKKSWGRRTPFPGNSVRGGDLPVASGAESPFTLKCWGTVTRGVKV